MAGLLIFVTKELCKCVVLDDVAPDALNDQFMSLSRWTAPTGNQRFRACTKLMRNVV